jgi:lysophospholipase L1-like esterase
LDSNGKFLTKPDLIVVNLGLNDALNGVDPDTITNNLTVFFEHINVLYTSSGTKTNFVLQMPYLFNQPKYKKYCDAYKNMFDTLKVSECPISLMDLSEGSSSIVFHQSDDKIHPNVHGY